MCEKYFDEFYVAEQELKEKIRSTLLLSLPYPFIELFDYSNEFEHRAAADARQYGAHAYLLLPLLNDVYSRRWVPPAAPREFLQWVLIKRMLPII